MGKIHFHQEMQNNITKKIINKMKQTALQYFLMGLIDLEIGKEIPTDKEKELHDLYNKAKEMEKNQIMNSWVKGVISDGNKTAEDYYNKTFKN